MNKQTIVLTGGGTAGHCYPALALLPQLKINFDKIAYIGSSNGIEKQIVKNYNIDYYQICTEKFKRSLSLSNFLLPFKVIIGIFQAKKTLKKLNPCVIFSKGGFVAVPVALAAKSLKIPIIGHESDYSIGLANKIISKVSKAMCCSFFDTSKTVKNGIFTGSPIRNEILNGDKNHLIKKYFLQKNLPTLFVVGGSLGSITINNYIYDNIEKLSQKYNIIHAVGKNNEIKETKYKNYHQEKFVSNIEDYYALCDAVICRAGSNVIFELLAIHKPMLLIPLSKNASRGDQILNANYFVKKGFALSLNEEDYSKLLLLKKIEQLIINKNNFLNNMKNTQLSIGNDEIIKLINKHKKTSIK